MRYKIGYTDPHGVYNKEISTDNETTANNVALSLSRYTGNTVFVRDSHANKVATVAPYSYSRLNW